MYRVCLTDTRTNSKINKNHIVVSVVSIGTASGSCNAINRWKSIEIDPLRILGPKTYQ